MLRLENIVKRYGDFLALDQVSLEVPAGKVFGLLGPNGAGKTTLIRIITRITGPDEGTRALRWPAHGGRRTWRTWATCRKSAVSTRR